MADEQQMTVSIEGPGKGKAYFDRAKTVAETGNYDYAIDMYIEGLSREPLKMDEHEALRDISLRRKIKGGKPAGGFLGAKSYFKGKTPKDQMLNAEWSLAKDPGNITLMLTMLKAAAAAGYREVVTWFGPTVIHANRTQKSPHPRIYLEMADLYESLQEYARALEAIQLAFQMMPGDPELDQRIKELSAQETLKAGQYESGGDFKDSLKDKETTNKLLQQENLTKSQDYLLKNIETSREAYHKNPTEHQNIAKYVKALIDMEDPDYENKAIDVLTEAYQRTKTYRYKASIGEIKMKQLRRDARMLAEAVKAHPDDHSLQQDLQKVEAERLKFETEEYHERTLHFPTDMGVLYEYGYRLYRARRFDEAIKAFQQAQTHPRHRAEALHLLGRCFLEQKMYREAVDTLRRAIESYDLAETGDARSKELHYWLARALEQIRELPEAEKIYSRITQWDIDFRDARDRLGALRVASEKQ